MGIYKRLHKDNIVAAPGFNRWRVPPASIAIHLCIGSVYAWSIFNPPLTKTLGVVGASARDWALEDVTIIFTIAIVCLGLSAAVAGKWLERVGPRMVGVVAACLWAGGFAVGGLGIMTHQLWLVKLGYGVLGGCGLGLGYVSPVSTLIRWFPDRRGMATGMAIMGFGGGAMIAAPMKEALLRFFYRAPERLGAIADVELITEGGKRLASVTGQLREVVVISADEGSKLLVAADPGVYLVGTGSTGVAETFFTLGAVYLVIMLAAAFSYRVPAPDWWPTGWTPPDAATANTRMISTHNIGMNEALKTPQFWLLWIVLCFNVTAGIGVISVAKTMMTEIFGSTLPWIVDGSFAATYVSMISVFNMAGRFVWASVSDKIGRKNTYYVFFIAGVLLYLSIPLTAMQVSASPSVVWLVAFYGATMLIFTMYGGGFATIPAYLADIFGAKFVGGIHGRLLTAWSVAAVLGNWAISSLRTRAVEHGIDELTSKVDPATFEQTFGAPLDQLPALVEAKTVTIPKLMAIAPPGTEDPSAGLYNTTMFLMAGLLLVALLANALIKPVDPKHHLRE
jgi:MFS family permease